MSESALSPNCAEMAETNRIHYELEYTEVKIVVAENNEYSRSNGFDLIQSTPEGSVELKTPSYVLTLKDQPVKFLEPNHSVEAAAQPLKGVCCNLHRRFIINMHFSHPLRPCPPLTTPEDWQILYSMSGVLSKIQCTTRHASWFWRVILSACDISQESIPKNIIKLNRRLLLLEQETKDRVRWEMYSVTVAFWLVNTWMWF
uniref:Mitochondrial fission factor n=1 Tax=Denticeps clupeoides TaxID=299321 RepID=A0AAY4ADN1_9TELE